MVITAGRDTKFAPQMSSWPQTRQSMSRWRSIPSKARIGPMQSPRKSRAASLPDALYWDTHDPYHYVRLQPLSERTNAVIIGGEDHKSGEADDGERRFKSLENWARDRLPQMGEVTHRWSGQCLEPADWRGLYRAKPGQ